ncbi:hypothetical protein BDZ91DRAFT_728401 [Kalaharituber pfeilii]|nr:hypothetical protein BDZ91DRAFT_728401 [Kalaharituber pfeilii]
MQFTAATIAAVAALLTSANAHVLLTNPGTYGGLGQDNVASLDYYGRDFPCGVSRFDSTMDGTDGPTLLPGESASVTLAGTAVHGGGSCQVSITYDQPPTKNSVWKVLRSYEGGCPFDARGNIDLGSVAGTDPFDNRLPPLTYTLPTDLPSGKATIAWTWYNRVGNRELYMRCHKATIGGTNTDVSALDTLPNMFVANLDGSRCKTVEGVNIRFPEPGANKVGEGDGDPICKDELAVRFSKEHLKRKSL